MPLTCGWPDSERGHRFCGQPAHIAFVIQAHDIPLIHTDSQPREYVLALCPGHDPTIRTEHLEP